MATQVLTASGIDGLAERLSSVDESLVRVTVGNKNAAEFPGYEHGDYYRLPERPGMGLVPASAVRLAYIVRNILNSDYVEGLMERAAARDTAPNNSGLTVTIWGLIGGGEHGRAEMYIANDGYHFYEIANHREMQPLGWGADIETILPHAAEAVMKYPSLGLLLADSPLFVAQNFAGNAYMLEARLAETQSMNGNGYAAKYNERHK
ncbi:hypothetical protein HYV82_02395 [Candidatus Woesearchaeota archaeon]|nr:hypothetical protein [Candidatus Woesearchaeota archaeon]